MPSSPRMLAIEALTAAAFAPFGDVIEAGDDRHHFAINDGYAQRYDDLARIDVNAGGGIPILSIFKARPRSLPLELSLLERHPLGSQAFMPLAPLPYLVVVAEAAAQPDTSGIRCFLASPGQGVNYARGTWHHPLLALQAPCDFLVVDRGGDPVNANCDEFSLRGTPIWIPHP